MNQQLQLIYSPIFYDGELRNFHFGYIQNLNCLGLPDLAFYHSEPFWHIIDGMKFPVKHTLSSKTLDDLLVKTLHRKTLELNLGC